MLLKNRALLLLAMSLAASLSAATRSQIGMLLHQSVAGNLADQTWQIANKRSESKQTSLPQAVPSRTWSIKYARTDWFWSYGEAKPWVGQYRWQNFELRRLDISSMSQRDLVIDTVNDIFFVELPQWFGNAREWCQDFCEYSQNRLTFDWQSHSTQNISFSGGLTKIATKSKAYMVAVKCGEGSCTGKLCFPFGRVANIDLRYFA